MELYQENERYQVRYKNSKVMKKTFIQFLKFGIVGVSNTLVRYLLNLLCLFVLDKYDVAFDFVIANTVAIGVPINYVKNKKWTFEE